METSEESSSERAIFKCHVRSRLISCHVPIQLSRVLLINMRVLFATSFVSARIAEISWNSIEYAWRKCNEIDSPKKICFGFYARKWFVCHRLNIYFVHDVYLLVLQDQNRWRSFEDIERRKQDIHNRSVWMPKKIAGVPSLVTKSSNDIMISISYRNYIIHMDNSWSRQKGTYWESWLIVQSPVLTSCPLSTEHRNGNDQDISLTTRVIEEINWAQIDKMYEYPIVCENHRHLCPFMVCHLQQSTTLHKFFSHRW